MRRLHVVLCGVVLAALPSTSALADTLYAYTGNYFISGYQDDPLPDPPFTVNDFISGWFTVASPLGVNLSETTVTPTSFSFSDGVETIATDEATTFYDFEIGTDATGTINAWSIELGNDVYAYLGTDFGPTFNADVAQTVTGAIASNFNDPGTWTVSTTDSTPATPEPSTLVLLGTGVLGLAGSIRRKLLS